ncbi:MAG: GNAT family N-acetyltransferase [Muribaculaceae bacterium]|nr:GNAT family N-acetyltransferase [Muribaculaceae bacterium]
MENIEIIDATPQDAELISHAILDAVGEELVANMAGSRHTRADVAGIFTRLARRDDTQYSYLNSRIALVDGKKAGVCVSYDGGLLKTLRRPFFQEANQTLGWNVTSEEVDALPGETVDEEFYLDTIATLPEYRGRGVASALIRDAKKKADLANLPLGLLVADDNPQARRLYDSLGFRQVGRRPFAGEIMTNLRLIAP